MAYDGQMGWQNPNARQRRMFPQCGRYGGNFVPRDKRLEEVGCHQLSAIVIMRRGRRLEITLPEGVVLQYAH